MQPTYHPIKSIRDIKRFLFAGNALLTLESEKTGQWFTYKITENKKDDVRFWVKVLTGNDNTHSYTYMGTIYGGKIFRLTKNSKIGETAPSFKAFDFFFKDLMINNHIHDQLRVYHSGTCARCGRTLTVPESLENGLGPECNSLVGNSLKEIRENKIKKYRKNERV